jgi:hypothetical protein
MENDVDELSDLSVREAAMDDINREHLGVSFLLFLSALCLTA